MDLDYESNIGFFQRNAAYNLVISPLVLLILFPDIHRAQLHSACPYLLKRASRQCSQIDVFLMFH